MLHDVGLRLQCQLGATKLNTNKILIHTCSLPKNLCPIWALLLLLFCRNLYYNLNTPASFQSCTRVNLYLQLSTVASISPLVGIADSWGHDNAGLSLFLTEKYDPIIDVCYVQQAHLLVGRWQKMSSNCHFWSCRALD